MRILYILTSLGRCGAERQALVLAERMSLRGHSVRVLALTGRLPEEWPTSLPVEYLGLRITPWSFLPALVLCLFKGTRCVRHFRPGLIHSHGFHANMAARLLRLFSPGTKLVSSIHNAYEGGRQRMTCRLTSFLDHRTIAVSQATRELLVRTRAVDAAKCAVVPNGIDTVEFAPRPERRAFMRMQMEASGDFVWLAAGRLVPAKDYPNLLRAFARVRSVRSDVRLWIAADPTGEEFARANSLIAELGLQDFVRWLGLRRDMPALFDAADGFVLSSAWEGMPLAMGEAMAMEKLVVATDVGGVRELLGDAGLLAIAGSPRALAQAMIEAIQMLPVERRTLGCAARQRIAGSFTLERAADRWEAIYKAIL